MVTGHLIPARHCGRQLFRCAARSALLKGRVLWSSLPHAGQKCCSPVFHKSLILNECVDAQNPFMGASSSFPACVGVRVPLTTIYRANFCKLLILNECVDAQSSGYVGWNGTKSNPGFRVVSVQADTFILDSRLRGNDDINVVMFSPLCFCCSHCANASSRHSRVGGNPAKISAAYKGLNENRSKHHLKPQTPGLRCVLSRPTVLRHCRVPAVPSAPDFPFVIPA